MLDITIINETEYDSSEYEAIIHKVFNEVEKQEKIDKDYEVSVIFVSKAKIQEINKTYRNIDKETDVISFSYLEDTEKFTNITTLGDIFICLDIMKEQAKMYNHSEEREVAFLAVHGLLHLLGYDHEDQEAEKIMFQKQEDILNNLNIKRNKGDESGKRKIT